MNELHFVYGVMGCSKSAGALMTKFNYEQQGFKVLLLKSTLDTRDKNSGNIVVKSRIGLEAPAITFSQKTSMKNLFKKHKADIIIVDECQFCTVKQIDELKELSEIVPVTCYGLKTDFRTKLFPGSKRLIEVADKLTELFSVCECGKPAIFNARFSNGKLVTSGSVIEIGGDEKYKALCYSCYNKKKQNKTR
ncbi:MAG: thymidine kinase [Clostridia bacterium]|nr:thymidine kinase [Clostridia bacterium]